jgi:endonuclease/exonuclease/phosphatase family metal-dependent hydrolase
VEPGKSHFFKLFFAINLLTKPRAELRKLIRKILIYITWIVAILLSLANLSVFISPELFWPIAFLGLLFPFLLILNTALFFYWIIRIRKLLILPFIVLLISWPNVQNTFQLSGDQETLSEKRQPSEKKLKILTYNVQIFNLLGNNTFGENQEEMFQKIKAENSDIICFQEFYTNEGKGLNISAIDNILAAYPYKHVYWISSSTVARYGIVIYSKHPIVNKSSIGFHASYNASIYSDIKFEDDTLRLFNNHLQSIKFNRDDYKFISDQSKFNQKEKLKAVQDISNRLKRAFIKRSNQANLLSRKISQSPYPVIVCGDFNDTPVSYTYRKIKGKLEDTFVNAGIGFANTYVGKFPSYRIDFVFHSKEMETKSFSVPRIEYSDHYPVTAEVVLR